MVAEVAVYESRLLRDRVAWDAKIGASAEWSEEIFMICVEGFGHFLENELLGAGPVFNFSHWCR